MKLNLLKLVLACILFASLIQPIGRHLRHLSIDIFWSHPDILNFYRFLRVI